MCEIVHFNADDEGLRRLARLVVGEPEARISLYEGNLVINMPSWRGEDCNLLVHRSASGSYWMAHGSFGAWPHLRRHWISKWPDALTLVQAAGLEVVNATTYEESCEATRRWLQADRTGDGGAAPTRFQYARR